MLAAEGYTVLRGWQPSTSQWDLSGARVACRGTISTEQEAAAATLAAARGAAIVVEGPVPSELLGPLVEDLRRLGAVELHATAPANPVARLDEEQRRLLHLLADGVSLGDAARALHISRRTADRRIAAARAVFGVATTVEAMALLAQSKQKRL
jgi:DNA-binding NarL/FixJ family response regulator